MLFTEYYHSLKVIIRTRVNMKIRLKLPIISHVGLRRVVTWLWYMEGTGGYDSEPHDDTVLVAVVDRL